VTALDDRVPIEITSRRGDAVLLSRAGYEALIDHVLRDPSDGVGSPSHCAICSSAAWSRRISEEHRLVYLVDGEDLGILPARFHDK
jgi:toxin YoeB